MSSYCMDFYEYILKNLTSEMFNICMWFGDNLLGIMKLSKITTKKSL